MSSLLDRPSGPARPAGGLPPSPFTAPVRSALRAAAGGLVPVAVPVVLAWVLGAGGTVTWAQTVRFSLGLWLLAHHAGLVVSGGHVGLVPLGLALVPLTATFFAGRWLARTMDPRAARIAARATRAAPAALSWRVLAVFVGAYGLIAALGSIAAGMDGMHPVSAQAVLGAAAVALCGGGLGAADYRYGGLRAAVRGLIERLPAAARPGVRPALAAQAVQSAVGAAVVAAMLVVHFSGVTALQRALDAGAAGSAVLTLGEALLVPNLALWACAVMAGPGFAIGAGSSITVTGSQLGPLPAIPVLAALPAPGALPAWAPLLLAVPPLAGAVAGAVVVRWAPDASTATRLGHVAAASVLSGLASGLLAWLSGGPAGPGRLAEVGPRPLATGVAAGLEVGAGAVLAVLVVGWAPRLADLPDRWRGGGAAGGSGGGRSARTGGAAEGGGGGWQRPWSALRAAAGRARRGLRSGPRP